MARPRQLAETSEWDVVPSDLLQRLTGSEPAVADESDGDSDDENATTMIPADVDPRVASVVASRLLRVGRARLGTRAHQRGEPALLCNAGLLACEIQSDAGTFEEERTYRSFVALCRDVQDGQSIWIERPDETAPANDGEGVSPLRLVTRLVRDRDRVPDRLCTTCDVVGDAWWEVVFTRDDRAVPVRIPASSAADHDAWSEVLSILTAWRDAAACLNGHFALLSASDDTRIVVRRGRHFGLCRVAREYVGIVLNRLRATM